MKLRQKLAVVLASAMVITAVPVTTMATSTNGFNTSLGIVADQPITTGEGLVLKVDYSKSDAEIITQGKTDVFFVDAVDFEFEKAAYNHKDAEGKDVPGSTSNDWDGYTVEYLDKDQLRVTVTKATNGTPVRIPIAGTPKKGNPAILLDGQGSLATSGKYALSGSEVVTDKLLVAKAGDVKNISVDGYGSIADITIEETVANSLSGKEVTITLQNSSDLIFHSDYATETKLSVEGKRGLAGQTGEVTAKYYKDAKGNVDDKKLVVTFPKMTSNTRGAIVLKDIKVQSEDRKGDVSKGEVKVTVKADKMEDTKLVVANVSDYGASLKVDEVEKLVAGQKSKEIELTLKENAIDSLSEKRDVYFTIEEGYFDVDNVDDFNTTNKDKGISINKDKDEITLNLQKAGFKPEKINEFKFKVNVAAKATQKGPVVVVASSRSFKEDVKVEVATVTPAVEITTEPITVKAGLKDQVGGKIVIKETEAESLDKNKEIRINCADNRYYGFDVKDAKVEVTEGDVEIKSEVKNGEIIITIKRSSDKPSTITVSDISITTDRTVPEGAFDFQVGGNAISKLNVEDKKDTTKDERYEDAIKLKDFVKVGTKNTEDLPNAAAVKDIVLTVGSTAYTVNGEAKTADAAPFIDANNRTMVPVKFVAEEFGKIDFGTVNGVGTVTIFKDGAVLQFQNGSNIMNKNGIAIPMDTNVIIKDGRTYVPFKYVADGLGVNYNFDAATKSITFTNQAK